MKKGKMKRERDVDRILFHQKSKDFEISGDPENSDIIKIAKREQIFRYVWRFGWLALGVIAMLLDRYEVATVVAAADGLKSLVFKLR